MQIHFLLTERLEGYVFNPHRPEGLSFSDATNDIQIEIRAGGKEDSHNYGYSNLELRAKVSREATESQV